MPPAPAARLWFLVIFALTFTAYLTTAILVGRAQTPRVAYFDYLAESFAHGRLDLPDPPGRHDLCEFNGKVYVVFPPLPALLLTPWVALAGRNAINTVAFSITLGALNVTLAALILDHLRRRGWIALSRAGQAWLLAAFGFGCAHWYAAIEGSAWFLGHICTLTFLLAAILAALRFGSLLPAGLLLAIAMLGRPHVILIAPVLVAIQRLVRFESDGCTTTPFKAIAQLGAPLFCSALLLAAYNQARFGNPFEFGYQLQNVETSLMGDLQGIGVFSPHYLMRNLKAMLIEPPLLDPSTHRLAPSDAGLGLLFSAPALLLAVGARRPRDIVHAAAWSIVLISVPLLLYYNAGWRQFGYRFSLDFLPPVFVLMALAAGGRLSIIARLLILLSVAVNLWGLIWWFDAAKRFV